MRDFITFRLNGKTRRIRNVSPTMTVLNYIRDLEGLKGLKEGCAEGDCGACTAVVGEYVGGEVEYKAVNTCIQFIAMLEGKSIFTIEHLNNSVNGVHPVQRALIDEHGSQCGFCTPGFVMSMYAAHINGDNLDTESAPDKLAGNLCRCTGYGPIAAAAARVGLIKIADWEAKRLEADRQWIRDQNHGEALIIESGGARFFSPTSIGDLAACYVKNPDAVLVAGATDVGLWITKAHKKLGTVIHIGRVRILNEITESSNKLIFGAGVTYTQAMEKISSKFPDFGELIRRIGGQQVRNVGTVGGNVANGSPIGDTLPALIVLQAVLVLRKGSTRRRLPIEGFFLDYGKQDIETGEFIESIEIPFLGPSRTLKCYKISKRFDQDISAVCGCFVIDVKNGYVESAKIAFGGMAKVPTRAVAAESALIDKAWTRETCINASAALRMDFSPITDFRASAQYRLKVAENLLGRYFEETRLPNSQTRLVGLGATIGGARQDSSFNIDVLPTSNINGGVRETHRHDSGHKHASGEASFVDDIKTPTDTLHVYIAMSEKAHAKVTAMDLSSVKQAPGVAIVVSAPDIPGVNDVSPVMDDDPLFADGIVEYAGQSLFAVAADTLEEAQDAAALAKIEYQDQRAILTIDEAMDQGSLLEAPYVMMRGNVDASIKAAPHVISGRLYIGGQEHFYLEGQVALCLPGEDGDVSIYCSSQHPSEIQHTVAKVLGLASNAVAVEVRRMGGAFGGKESNGNLPAAVVALVSSLTGRASKICYDRDQDMIITGKRHDFRIDYQVGFDADGQILGVTFDQAARCGMSFDLSVPICDRAMFHADNCYYLPNVRITSFRCKTNTVSNTAFRGFGGPQGMLGIERVIDQIAHYLRIDPLNVRRVNFYDSQEDIRGRSVTPYEMRVEDCIIDDLVSELAEKSEYDSRRKEINKWNESSPILKRGLALTPVKFGISFTLSFLNQAGALVHIYSDGSIHLNHGGTEMGQGLFTKVAQVVASAFQVDIDRIKITPTHTGKVPNTSATAASAGSDLNGMAARDACEKIKGRLRAFASERWQTEPEKIYFLPGRVQVGSAEVSFDDLVYEAYRARVPLSATGFYATPKINWDKKQARGRPFYYFAYGAAVTEVAIDTLTGENRLLRVDILHDVGKSLNPAIDLGQIEGGFVQGVGWLTTEELWWDKSGQLKTHAPSTYKIPTLGDRAPDMRMEIWNRGKNFEPTIHRSKAVGEPPLMLAISALMALSDAVTSVGNGQHYPSLDAPATPERILAAVERMRDFYEIAI